MPNNQRPQSISRMATLRLEKLEDRRLLHASSAVSFAESSVASNQDWMAQLPNNTRLMDVSIPGTHDTMARFGGAIGKTQTMTLRQQLDSGVRFVDIRTDYVKKNGRVLKVHCRTGDSPSDCSFEIYHGPTYQNASLKEDVLDVVVDFLDQHPTETIIMRLRRESDKSNAAIVNEFDAEIDNVLRESKYKSKLLNKDNCTGDAILGTTPLTSTDDCHARGKLAIIIENFSSYKTLVYNPPTLQQNAYSITKSGWYGKWEAIEDHLQAANDAHLSTAGQVASHYINYLSANFGLTPVTVASGHTSIDDDTHLWTGLTTTNRDFQPEFIHANCLGELCSIFVQGMNVITMEKLEQGIYDHVGIVIADFPGPGLINSIIETNEFNSAPSIRFSPNTYEITEGGRVTLTALASDSNSVDTLTSNFSLPGCQPIRRTTKGETPQATYQCNTPGFFTAEITTTDGYHTVGPTKGFVQVNNAPPTLSIDTFEPVPEFGPGFVRLTGRYADRSANDDHLLRIHWGNVNGGFVDYEVNGGSFSRVQQYFPITEGRFNVRVQLFDGTNWVEEQTFIDLDPTAEITNLILSPASEGNASNLFWELRQ